ncbi:pyrrolysine--tRNA(Pyl) ligase small subunit [Desulfospira joergensenii]|uniref:pyrrolysine--tRNA(Pyl) ligase small subunit n=1 Tax=Desulfospira joergensenii TaxID=53329 RepID=UPI0003B3B230|nr:pyrrolysine--tRNA(Pyl) ligase small subunit [Desulfospira joergensenii]
MSLCPDRGTPVKRTYQKRVSLFRLLHKMKLWPSRKGVLHGIRAIEQTGDRARITTHCNQEFLVRDSRTSRATRALRNKWFVKPCSACAVPDWKLDKYSTTRFSRHYGSALHLEEAVSKEEAGA